MKEKTFIIDQLKNIIHANVLDKSVYHFNELPFDFSLANIINLFTYDEKYYLESKDKQYSFLSFGIKTHFDRNSFLDFVNQNTKTYLIYQGQFEDNLLPQIYLPKYQFILKENNLTLIHFSPLNELLTNIKNDDENILFHPPLNSSEEPNYEGWEKMILKSLDLFRNSSLEKVVLSRKKIFNYKNTLASDPLFLQFYKSNQQSSHYRLFHKINNEQAFVSFTPEHLFEINHNYLQTISLAGSAPRGESREEDLKWEKHLQDSPKLILEHAIVTKTISERLIDKIEDLAISELSTMKLPYIQHRQASIQGKIKANMNVCDYIDLLHPTPAVGGHPDILARKNILEIETVPRKYYAAPTGIISKDESKILVGIRSAFIDKNSINVYAGAGIVEGSDAKEEWQETENKMGPFLRTLL